MLLFPQGETNCLFSITVSLELMDARCHGPPLVKPEGTDSAPGGTPLSVPLAGRGREASTWTLWGLDTEAWD